MHLTISNPENLLTPLLVGTAGFSATPAYRQEVLRKFRRAITFVAYLARTEHLALKGYEWWALVVMRELLETPDFGSDHEDLEALLTAAVGWVSIAGPQIYARDYEFPYGGNLGDRGRGGPLWNGKHGFCKERWALWKQRFVELSSPSSGLSESLRNLCSEGAAKMVEVEAQVARPG